MVNEIRDVLAVIDPELMLVDGYDHCVIGVASCFGVEDTVAYDTQCILATLTKDMTLQEASEFFEYNILGSYVGDRTPLFINKVETN